MSFKLPFPTKGAGRAIVRALTRRGRSRYRKYVPKASGYKFRPGKYSQVPKQYRTLVPRSTRHALYDPVYQQRPGWSLGDPMKWQFMSDWRQAHGFEQHQPRPPGGEAAWNEYNRMQAGRIAESLAAMHKARRERKRKSRIRNADVPYGMAANPEYKYKTFVDIGTLSNTITFFGPYNGISQGDNDDQRVGLRATMLSFFVTGYFVIEGVTSTSDNDHANLLRWGVLINRRTRQNQPDAAELFEFTTTTNTLRNVKFMQKYTIIHNERFNVNHDTTHDGTSHRSVDYYKPFEWKKSLNLATTYTDTGEMVAHILDNSIYIYAYLENVSPEVRYNWDVRIKFRE